VSYCILFSTTTIKVALETTAYYALCVTSIWKVEWSEAGGPGSTFVFVTATDILGIAMRNQENMKGTAMCG